MENGQQLSTVTWHKASYSGNTGGECVEVANLTALVAVRDSKYPEAGRVAVAPQAWNVFLRDLK